MNIINMNLVNMNLAIIIGVTLMAVFLSRIDALEEKYLRVFYLFAGGNLLAMISLDIIPGAISDIGIGGMLLFLLIGIVLFYMMHEVIHAITANSTNGSYITIGTALATHGLPEGMALGVAMGASGMNQYWSLLMIFLIHILPEMIMFQQSMKENKRIRRITIIIASILIFIPAIVGILMSIVMGGHVEGVIGVLSATAGGFIFMLVVKELIFRYNKQLKLKDSFIIILGSVLVAFILGV